MPETCKDWLGPVNNCVNYARQTRDIYHVVPYSVDFKFSAELWFPLSKTVLSICSCIKNKGPVNFLNDGKAQK